MVKKNFNGSLSSLVLAFVVISMMAISCTKSEEGLQSTQSEIQSKRRPSGGGGSETNNSVPQVTGLTANAAGPTVVNLSWNSVPNATSYWVYRDSYVPAIVTSTNYADGYLTSGTTYTYAIAAVVSSTLGPKSASVTVTTP